MLSDGVKERINGRKNKLKSRKASGRLLTEPLYPIKERDIDCHIIEVVVNQIEIIVADILELIKGIRKYFTNIWDENNIIASYLLIGKAYKNLLGVLREAKAGNISGVIELCRSGQEAIDLLVLFLDRANGDQLKRWFNGEIIKNKRAREGMDKSVNDMLFSMSKDQVSVKEMKADIYWTFSLFTHSGYGAMFELIDPYHEDFDFDEFAGFHYTRESMHIVDSLVVNVLLGLKNIFLVCKDRDGLTKTESLLTRFRSQFASPEEIVETQKKYHTNTKKN